MSIITVIYCGKCGWQSPELLKEELQALGLPWWCQRCNERVTNFLEFEPEVRVEAHFTLDLLKDAHNNVKKR